MPDFIYAFSISSTDMGISLVDRNPHLPIQLMFFIWLNISPFPPMLVDDLLDALEFCASYKYSLLVVRCTFFVNSKSTDINEAISYNWSDNLDIVRSILLYSLLASLILSESLKINSSSGLSNIDVSDAEYKVLISSGVLV